MIRIIMMMNIVDVIIIININHIPPCSKVPDLTTLCMPLKKGESILGLGAPAWACSGWGARGGAA